jgi:hypothetical protein
MQAYRFFRADCIVAEVNQGGEMVKIVLAQVDAVAAGRAGRGALCTGPGDAPAGADGARGSYPRSARRRAPAVPAQCRDSGPPPPAGIHPPDASRSRPSSSASQPRADRLPAASPAASAAASSSRAAVDALPVAARTAACPTPPPRSATCRSRRTRRRRTAARGRGCDGTDSLESSEGVPSPSGEKDRMRGPCRKREPCAPTAGPNSSTVPKSTRSASR